MNVQLELHRLAVLIGGYTYRFANETQLQAGIAGVLESAGYAFERELKIDADNRLDFLVEGRIAIEVKVDGSFSQAITQVTRYAALEKVSGVLLAATLRWATQPVSAAAKPAFHSKPVEMVLLRRKAL